MRTNGNKLRALCRAGIIAALYAALTLMSAAVGLSAGPVQLRLAEMLCVLPCFTASAVPGLALGCLLANALSGCLLPDVVFGTLATLIAAIGSRLLARYARSLALLPPIVVNALIIPWVLVTFYGAEGGYWLLVGTVGLGQLLSAGLFGGTLATVLTKYGKRLFD